MKLPDWSTRESNESFYQNLREFRDHLLEEDEGVDFKKSARGWGYYLENEGIITKKDLDTAGDTINKLRKNEYSINCSLPVDFTAQDDARTWYCDDYHGHYDGPKHYIETKGNAVVNGWGYDGHCFWDSQDVFIQVLVEKIDLVSLFKPICDEYNIPISTSKGWPSINQRSKIISRFYEWQQNGNQPVLLYCGDHDPAGLHISDTLRDNLSSLKEAKIPDGNGGYITGWDPEYTTIDRFGLNADFINEHDITWIDNLETDSGDDRDSEDLANPTHQDHDKPYVQDYLAEHGARKVEANAMVTKPEASRELFRETVEDYLGPNPMEQYQSDLEADRELIRDTMQRNGVGMRIDSALDEIP